MARVTTHSGPEVSNEIRQHELLPVLSPAESHLCFQVLLKMGLRRQKGVAISLQSADHQRPLEKGDDESGRFFRIDTPLDLLLPYTGADDRAQEFAPLP